MLPFELNNDVNLSKRSPKKWTFKKQDALIPFTGDYEKIVGSPRFHSKINLDEVS